jgi:hypothetical protein
MKTAKAKTVRQPKKTAETSKTPKKKKVAPVKNIPGEEEIRQKAREIYFERISRGEHGTPEDDWREAEQLLMGS